MSNSETGKRRLLHTVTTPGRSRKEKYTLLPHGQEQERV